MIKLHTFYNNILIRKCSENPSLESWNVRLEGALAFVIDQ